MGGVAQTLSHFLDNDPSGEFVYLWDENDDFVPREDVWVRYEREFGALKHGDLNVGFGTGDDSIGPEYSFGYRLGAFMDDQVLIIKTAWGGKNLAVEFRPPGSGSETGPYYQQILEDVGFAIINIQNEFINWTEYGIEVSTEAFYDFVVTGDRSLIANFTIASNFTQIEPGTFLVYPNPSSGIFTIVLEESVSGSVTKIFKMSGEQVFQRQTSASKIEIEPESFENGVYLIQLISDGNNHQTKFILSQ